MMSLESACFRLKVLRDIQTKLWNTRRIAICKGTDNKGKHFKSRIKFDLVCSEMKQIIEIVGSAN